VNVYGDEWPEAPYQAPPGWEQKAARLVPSGRGLGMTLYELYPGQTQVAYHFHHGNEEGLVVLRGRPSVRTPEGERELAPGDVVFFPKGPEGAHQVVNRTEEPARYLIAASHVSPEVVEHVDSGKVLAMSQLGLWTVHRRADAVDYFEGEEPRA
jgi:uncharacterized cupin superfamily protein